MKIFTTTFTSQFPLKYWLICIIYFALSFIGILHHEIWLDEMHHYLLARDSRSLQELFYNARYDGHPLLWNCLLFFLTRFTHDPFYMQLLHIFISLAAVIVFLRYAPFSDVFKVLFVFGYFMFYEYNIISRNYSLSVLFLFISCSLLVAEKRNYKVIIPVLLLFAYTHLLSLLCAVSLFIVTICLYTTDKEKTISPRYFRLLSFFFIVITLFILVSIFPPSDHVLKRYDTTPYLSFRRIGKAFSIFFKGLYHLPDFAKYNFWNTNLMVDVSKELSIIPSVFCFLIPLILFFDKPYSLFVFYLSCLGIASFIFFSPIIASVRYFGYVTLMFITALWLSKFFPVYHFKRIPKAFDFRLNKFNQRFLSPFVYSFLFIQLVSSFVAYSLDLARPFSEGKAVSEYLKQNQFTKMLIVVSFQNGGPPISGYLDQKLYYPETNDTGSFCIWNTNPHEIDKTELINRLHKINEEDFILILNDSTLDTSADVFIPVFSDSLLRIFYLTSFHKGIMRTENYRLYAVKRKI